MIVQFCGIGKPKPPNNKLSRGGRAEGIVNSTKPLDAAAVGCSGSFGLPLLLDRMVRVRAQVDDLRRLDA
jgi:hypothetical protein